MGVRPPLRACTATIKHDPTPMPAQRYTARLELSAARIICQDLIGSILSAPGGLHVHVATRQDEAQAPGFHISTAHGAIDPRQRAG